MGADLFWWGSGVIATFGALLGVVGIIVARLQVRDLAASPSRTPMPYRVMLQRRRECGRRRLTMRGMTHRQASSPG
jgi:hypothetical protein